jgi:hypothetical protein
MHSPSRALVHELLASLLRTANATINDADGLDEVGADARVLFSVVAKLEQLVPENGGFPIVSLAHAKTVGDLVELVESWSRRDGPPDTMGGTGLRSSVSARGRDRAGHRRAT